METRIDELVQRVHGLHQRIQPVALHEGMIAIVILARFFRSTLLLNVYIQSLWYSCIGTSAAKKLEQILVEQL